MLFHRGCAVSSRRSSGDVDTPASLAALLGRPLLVYLAGLVAVQIYADLLHALLFGYERLQFLPLMLLSVYTAAGVVASWLLYYRAYLLAPPKAMAAAQR